MGDFQPIIDAIGPTENLHWDIFLYTLFFFNLIMMFILPDGATLHTMLIIFVLISIFIDKTYAFGHLLNSDTYDPETCHAKVFVGTYLIRALIFVSPLMIAGSTEEGKVRGLAILLGILGAGYMIGRWFLEQREYEGEDIVCMNAGTVAQNTVMIITLAYATLRRSAVLLAVNRVVPGAILRELAPDEVEV